MSLEIKIKDLEILPPIISSVKDKQPSTASFSIGPIPIQSIHDSSAVSSTNKEVLLGGKKTVRPRVRKAKKVHGGAEDSTATASLVNDINRVSSNDVKVLDPVISSAQNAAIDVVGKIGNAVTSSIAGVTNSAVNAINGVVNMFRGDSDNKEVKELDSVLSDVYKMPDTDVMVDKLNKANGVIEKIDGPDTEALVNKVFDDHSSEDSFTRLSNVKRGGCDCQKQMCGGYDKQMCAGCDYKQMCGGCDCQKQMCGGDDSDFSDELILDSETTTEDSGLDYEMDGGANDFQSFINSLYQKNVGGKKRVYSKEAAEFNDKTTEVIKSVYPSITHEELKAVRSEIYQTIRNKYEPEVFKTLKDYEKSELLFKATTPAVVKKIDLKKAIENRKKRIEERFGKKDEETPKNEEEKKTKAKAKKSTRKTGGAKKTDSETLELPFSI